MGVVWKIAVAASLCACTADRGDSQPSTDAGVELAPVRASDLRARFARVIAPGVAGMRFEVASGRVRATVPDGEKRSVLRAASVVLPVRANEAVRLEDDTTHVAIGFTLRDARPVGVVTDEGLAVYPKAFAGSDVIHRVHGAGTEDFIVFETKPAREEAEYLVDVSQAAGLRLVSNTLEFLDVGGTPRLRVAPPYVVDARGARHDAALAVEGCAYDTNTAAPWDRPVTPAGSDRCVVKVRWSAVDYPAVLDPTWTATGSMATPRNAHTATLLGSGKVLVAGGFGPTTSDYLSSAELFDGTSSFAATGAMKPRAQHTATLLASGKVLLAGGTNDGSSSAEIFDGASFAGTGYMVQARAGHAATLLPSGKVLIVAGAKSWGSATLAELFDGVGTFTATTGAMNADHGQSPTATLLASGGQVLVVGGTVSGSAMVSTAELFDGVGTFTLAGSTTTWRYAHGAALLPSGKVLIVGGNGLSGGSIGPISSAEQYAGGSFTGTGAMAEARTGHTTTPLASGRVLVTGGSGSGGILSSTEAFDLSGTFVPMGSMTTPRIAHTATRLATGKVLVTGGYNSGGHLSTAEILPLVPLGAGCSASTDCDSGQCVDGHCCNTTCASTCDACDVAGSVGTCSHVTGLPHGTHGSCGSYICQGASSTCPTSCADDTGCAAAAFCSAGACIPKRAVGAACPTGVHECASGFCVDGVCCSTACSGTCQSCAASLKVSGADGTRGAVADGTDDPRGACAKPTCTAGMVTRSVCNGSGACRDNPTSCAPFKCNPAGTDCDHACTTDADCGATSGNYCASGSCVPKKKRGETCAGNNECVSTFCADSVCCDSACTGSCQACGEPGKEGTCVPVMGAPRAGHPACKSAGTTCGGTCDGSKAFDCSFPGASTTCGDGCKGSAIAHCDGAGACSSPTACPGNFNCADANSCKSSCAADSDCAGGYTCKSGACSPATATCSADGKTSTSASGVPQECSPYRCTSTGACGTECTTSKDCADDATCDPSSKQCQKAATEPPPEGCNCSLAPANSSRAIALLPFLALVFARRRRRGSELTAEREAAAGAGRHR